MTTSQKSESNRLTDLIECLRGSAKTASKCCCPTFWPDSFCNVAAAAIEAQAKRIAELEAAFREIYEVYAGSEGFIPETCAEAYQQQLIKELADIAARHMRKGVKDRK